MSKVKLHYDETKQDSAPMIASFRNGPPPRDTLTITQNPLQFKCYEHQKKKKQKLLVTETEKMIYQGANFAHQSSASDLASYAVGVYDKKTNSVEIFAVPHIYSLQQRIKGFCEHIELTKSEESTFFNQKRDLVEAFGNKISKKVAKSYEENKVEVTNVSSAGTITNILEKKVALSFKEKNESLSKDSHRLNNNDSNEILPPYNIAAATPAEVYDPYNLITSEEMEALSLKAQELVDEVSSSSMSHYIASHQIQGFIAQQLLRVLKPYDHQLIGYLIYVQYMIIFLSQRYPLKKPSGILSQELEIPPVIINVFLQMYTEVTQAPNGMKTYSQSKVLKDKLLMHLLANALNACGHSIEIDELAADLKKSPVYIKQYCRLLGCKVDKVKKNQNDSLVQQGNTRATLSVPLQLPSMTKAPIKRR